MKPFHFLYGISIILLFLVLKVKASPLGDTAYSISICADVPDNKRPGRVFYKGEPGHVFVVLKRSDSTGVFKECIVWGFYPKKAITCVLFRKVKGRLVDNSNKPYDVSVTRALNKAEYHLLLTKALELSKKKYHINRYNCYHYALELFNSLQPVPALRVSDVPFPFPFGRGGSPCCLYRDLLSIAASHSSANFYIQFGEARAPSNVMYQNVTVKNSH